CAVPPALGPATEGVRAASALPDLELAAGDGLAVERDLHAVAAGGPAVGVLHLERGDGGAVGGDGLAQFVDQHALAFQVAPACVQRGAGGAAGGGDAGIDHRRVGGEAGGGRGHRVAGVDRAAQGEGGDAE